MLSCTYYRDGSLKSLTDMSGKTLFYGYDAFGSLLEQKGSITNRILYTGQQYDQETGQYYLRARYYNPVVGRFLQEDTYRGDGLNLYAYCANNPVMYFDPSGHNGIYPDDQPKMVDTPGGQIDGNNIITDPARLLETTKNPQDHHIIPAFRGKSEPYADFIRSLGIDVDQYTVTIPGGKGGAHMNFIHGKGKWNQKWMNFIDNNQNATAKDVFQFAGQMMDEYGLSGLEIHPFHKK